MQSAVTLIDVILGRFAPSIFRPRTIHLMDISPHGQVAPWKIRPLGQFDPLVNSTLGQFAKRQFPPCTVRPRKF